MKVLLLVTLVGAASAFVERTEWEAYKAKYGKSYRNPQEEAQRMTIYAKHKKYVQQHQQEFAAGLHTYEVELNQFADLSTEEWTQRFLGYRSTGKKGDDIHKHSGRVADVTVDWRDQGYVTPIKDQGQCGSCWAFSATGSLEGAYKKAGNPLTSFSEQQLVDCSRAEGNLGCNGGEMDDALRYIQKEGGIEKEGDYPYKAKNHHCEAQKSKEVEMSIKIHDIPPKSETDLADAVSSVGPVSVAIDASHTSFQLYSRGVYNERRCKSADKDLDHGVLVVGYGEEAGKAYWLVKNSWGTSWGMEGYIMMTKDKSNQCGIATDASYPIVM